MGIIEESDPPPASGARLQAADEESPRATVARAVRSMNSRRLVRCTFLSFEKRMGTESKGISHDVKTNIVPAPLLQIHGRLTGFPKRNFRYNAARSLFPLSVSENEAERVAGSQYPASSLCTIASSYS